MFTNRFEWRIFVVKNSLYTAMAHQLYGLELPLRIIRREHNNSLFVPDMHSHEFSELVIVTSGSATHRVITADNEQYGYRIERGSAFMINVGEEHEYLTNDGESVMLTNIIYDPQIINRLNVGIGEKGYCSDFLILLPQLKPALRFNPTCRLNDTDMKKVEALLKMSEEEQNETRFGSEAVRVSLFCAIGTAVYRMYAETFENEIFKKEEIKVNGILRVLEYISKKFGTDIQMKDLAKIAMCSERHLARNFKKITGQTVSGYIQKQRIINSCRLLKNTDMQINEIASAVGFNDCSFFIRTFRKTAGCTPKEYRKESVAFHKK